MNKVVDIKTAIDQVKTGDKVMIGGFTNIGCPVNLVDELATRKEVKHLTTISEDFGYSGLPYLQGPGKLLANGQLDEIIVTFLGSHKEANEAISRGELKLTLVPQGTFIERIRIAGAGIGGFYTPTGVGTVVEEGKETKVIDGRKYILEMPLHANVALVKCHTADRMGNATFRYTAQNFNTMMATAADIVILACEKLEEPGEIRPDAVQLPGVFVDYVVHCEEVAF